MPSPVEPKVAASLFVRCSDPSLRLRMHTGIRLRTTATLNEACDYIGEEHEERQSL